MICSAMNNSLNQERLQLLTLEGGCTTPPQAKPPTPTRSLPLIKLKIPYPKPL